MKLDSGRAGQSSRPAISDSYAVRPFTTNALRSYSPVWLAACPADTAMLGIYNSWFQEVVELSTCSAARPGSKRSEKGQELSPAFQACLLLVRLVCLIDERFCSCARLLAASCCSSALCRTCCEGFNQAFYMQSALTLRCSVAALTCMALRLPASSAAQQAPTLCLGNLTFWGLKHTSPPACLCFAILSANLIAIAL